MKVWKESPACQGRKQCLACRSDESLQAGIAEMFEVPDDWPACPFDVTLEKLEAEQPMRDRARTGVRKKRPKRSSADGSTTFVSSPERRLSRTRLDICKSCKKWSRKLKKCSLWPKCAASFKGRTFTQNAVCLDEPMLWAYNKANGEDVLTLKEYASIGKT